MEDRNSDGTYNNIGISSHTQQLAGVNRSDSKLTACIKVQEAEIKAQNQQRNSRASLSDVLATGLGIGLIIAIYLSVNYVRHSINEACIFGIAFDTHICEHKKALQDRLPVTSREEIVNLLKSNDASILSAINQKACSSFIGESGYCNLVEAIRREIDLKFSAKDNFGNLNEKPFLENSQKYFRDAKLTNYNKKIMEWENQINSEENSLRQLLIGKWQSVGCKSANSSIIPADCKNYTNMTIKYSDSEVITRVENGKEQRLPFSLTELSGSGHHLKSRAGSIWSFRSDNQIILKWKDFIFALERVK